MTVVGRLAPSPTGLLHVGNARSLLAAWLSARAQGGKVLLRVEDLLPDMAGHELGLLDDLRWLGLDWDDADDTPGRTPAGYVRQSERTAVYQAAVAELQSRGWVYPCICTRKDIETAARAPHAEDKAAAYPGTCRGRFGSEAEALAAARAEQGPSAGVALRLQVPERPVTFTDRLCGVRTVHLPSDSGDLVVRRKDGGFAYMFAVVVDDAGQGVTEVVRGDDLLDATAQQLAVYAALGHTAVPSWVHLPLVLGDEGRRLAKRNRSLQISALRELGVRSETLRAWLAESLGLPATGALTTLVQAFDWARVPRQPVVFGAAQARQVVAAASPDACAAADAATHSSAARPG